MVQSERSCVGDVPVYDFGQADRGWIWRVLITIWGLEILVYVGLALFPLSLPLQHIVACRLPFYGLLSLDDLLHFLSFFLLAVPVPLTFCFKLDAYLALLFLVLLAVVTELLQLFIPHRRFDLVDLSANLLGCLVGFLLGAVLRCWCDGNKKGRHS
ncbi:polysaccharide biosynthesis protein VpsQ [Desulfovibrionales bacterium]